jgi:hypothetical protein
MDEAATIDRCRHLFFADLRYGWYISGVAGNYRRRFDHLYYQLSNKFDNPLELC